MTPKILVSGLSILPLAAAAVWPPLAIPAHRFFAADHPTAVLAWVKLRCDPNAELADGAPLTNYEDLIAVAGAYDSAARYRDLKELCGEASRSAALVRRPSSR